MEKEFEKIIEANFGITLDELEEKYNDIVNTLEEKWKTGCVNDYRYLLTGGFHVKVETGRILKSVGWERMNSNEYYPGYSYISILDNNYKYETTSESDLFIGCEKDDPEYIHYLETGEVSDFMLDCMLSEYPVYFKEFDDVVTEIVEIVGNNNYNSEGNGIAASVLI